MDQTEKLDYLKELFLETGSIYTWHFTPDMELISHNCPMGEQVKDIILLSACYQNMDSYIKENNKPFFLHDDLSFSWIAVPVFDGQTPDSVYLLGPVCSSHTSEDFIKSKMDLMNMSVKSKRTMLRILDHIPVIPPVFFSYQACQFYYALTGHTITLSDIQYPFTAKETVAAAEDGFFEHNSYDYECMFLKNVEEGILTPVPMPAPPRLIQPGLMCPGNPLRQAQDEIIVSTALVTRAAIRGGYAPESAYSLSDHYIQAIESTSDISEIYQIGQTMREDFVRRVHNAKQNDIHNILIRRCIDYIDNHLTETIDLEGVAEELGYTKYYLTRRFKEEMNMSVNQYILSRRIETAKMYLVNSRMSILEISERLQFSSPSHFTSVFRKMTGKTPTEYRLQT